MRILTITLALLTLVGCGDDPDQASVNESLDSAKVESTTDDVVELSTHFTLGTAVTAAAEELKAFIEAEAPCAEVTRAEGTVTVVFGVTEGCAYNGHDYTGTVAIEVEKNEADQTVVHHAWTALSNGEITVDGTATVTRQGGGDGRHVVHEATWTDGERVVHTTGDRTLTLLDPASGINGGIEVNGARTWENETNGNSGTLSIEGVEMRPMDPVPQAGQYLLEGTRRDVTLSFERLDEDTIAVTWSNGRREKTFEVTSIQEPVE
jgi:hypothetical protein